MTQPTPTVSQSDVDRIVERDYPEDSFAAIRMILERYNSNEPHRVRLAILKLANGNVTDLKCFVESARCDFRDVLSPAEYPLATKKWSQMGKMATDEKETIYRKDWEQYQNWLYKP
jgi:hypothetical protein